VGKFPQPNYLFSTFACYICHAQVMVCQWMTIISIKYWAACNNTLQIRILMIHSKHQIPNTSAVQTAYDVITPSEKQMF